MRFNTFVAEVSCPKCQHPLTSVRADPRGIDLPHCCGFYWVPRWKIVGGKLQFHLTYYRPEGMAYEKNIIHENEIREDRSPSTDTDTVSGASESSDTQTDTDAEIPENSVKNSAGNALTETSTAENPVMGQPSDAQLTVKERIIEFLVQVNHEQTARTGEIRNALGLAPSTFDGAINERINDGKVLKVGYGLYQRKNAVG